MGKRTKIENKKFFRWQIKIVTHRRKIYNPQNTIIDSQTIIIFNHIYQHHVFHIVKYIDNHSVSMNVKIQGLPGTGKTFISNTIRNIDINLNHKF